MSLVFRGIFLEILMFPSENCSYSQGRKPFVVTYQTIRRHIVEDRNLHNRRYNNLKSHIIKWNSTESRKCLEDEEWILMLSA
jgi:hypothetical protein